MTSDPLLIQSRGLVLDCRPNAPGGAHVMGVLNVTPDSFSDGGDYLDPDAAVDRALELVRSGARLIDIGGASSRPAGSVYGEGARLVPADEEWRRIEPVVECLAAKLDESGRSEGPNGVWISVDTFRADVADRALSAGAHLINDITALRFDPEIADVAAAHGVAMCLMHSVGLPGGMPHAKPMEDVVGVVQQELADATERAVAAGVQQIILDPGFGFGKTVDDNLRLIAHVDAFTLLERPVLIGVSRKSSIGAAMVGIPAGSGSGDQAVGRPEDRPEDAPVTGNKLPPPLERLNGSLAATAVAVLRGARIVRTHDVRQTSEFLRVLHRTVRTADE